MINKTNWLLIVLFALACNTEKKSDQPADSDTTASHKEHEVAANKDYCDSVNSGIISNDTLKGSPHRTAMAMINDNHVHIEYNSPGVKGRTIWGGLVAYDKVWATGAHNATTVQFDKDVMINGKKVPAGKYGFFTIPGKDKWIVILNTRHDQHMADDYNEKEDVIRVDVKPKEHSMTQRLTYAVNKINDQSGEILMQWEKILIRLPFVTNL